MSTIVTRTGKGSPLTIAEMDANFTNLNNDKIQVTGTPVDGYTITWDAANNRWVPGKIQPKILNDTSNSATPTINTDLYDMVIITGQSVPITSFTTNLSGTPFNGQKLWIAITGVSSISLSWGSSFESSTLELPTTTVNSTRINVGFIWNSSNSKWTCVATA